MTSTNRPFDRRGPYDLPQNPPHEPPHEPLFDQLERELAALTFAPLEFAPLDAAPIDPTSDPTSAPGSDAASRHCVDEFSNEFLNWSMPPPRYGRARHSVR